MIMRIKMAKSTVKNSNTTDNIAKDTLTKSKTKKREENEFLAVHEDTVKSVREKMPSEEALYNLSDLFRIFADSSRIKVLYCLMDGELCVNDIAQILNFTQSSVSHQLRILKDAKLVKFRREGKIIFYSLDDEHVQQILSMGMEHLSD